MKRTKIVVLTLLVALAATAWSELSIQSPVQGWIGRSIRAGSERALAKTSRPPCESPLEDFQLNGIVVVVPDCMTPGSITTSRSRGVQTEIVTITPGRRDDYLLVVSVTQLPPDHHQPIRSRLQEQCSADRHGEWEAWRCDLSRTGAPGGDSLTLLSESALVQMSLAMANYYPEPYHEPCRALLRETAERLMDRNSGNSDSG